MTRRRIRACECQLLIAGSFAQLLARYSFRSDTAQNRVLEETFERVYTIEPTTTVTIHNGDGAVLVYGSNVNEMQVHAVKKAYQRTRLTQIAIDVSAKPGSISITTKFPPKPRWALFDRSGTVDYTIVVPAMATISGLDLDAGEILLNGMQGPTTRARLGEGRIFAHNCFSNLDLAMRRGNVIVWYDWWQGGKLSAQADIAQGNVWAYIPGDAAFHLLAKATHGKIASDFNSITIAEPASAARMKIDTLVNGGGRGHNENPRGGRQRRDCAGQSVSLACVRFDIEHQVSSSGNGHAIVRHSFRSGQAGDRQCD